jgi:hypothetical protein
MWAASQYSPAGLSWLRYGRRLQLWKLKTVKFFRIPDSRSSFWYTMYSVLADAHHTKSYKVGGVEAANQMARCGSQAPDKESESQTHA